MDNNKEAVINYVIEYLQQKIRFVGNRKRHNINYNQI